MSWEVLRLKEGEKRFIIVGEGYRLEGQVWRGGMKNDVYWGLKSLVSWPCRERMIHHPWTMIVPKRAGAENNTGAERRYLEFRSPHAPGFMLRFDSYVPKELVAALREVFEGRQGDQKP